MKIKLHLLREKDWETFLEDVQCYKICLLTFLSNSLLIKTYQRDRVGDAWRNDSMMMYIEKAIYTSIDEKIFQPPNF